MFYYSKYPVFFIKSTPAMYTSGHVLCMKPSDNNVEQPSAPLLCQVFLLQFRQNIIFLLLFFYFFCVSSYSYIPFTFKCTNTLMPYFVYFLFRSLFGCYTRVLFLQITLVVFRCPRIFERNLLTIKNRVKDERGARTI